MYFIATIDCLTKKKGGKYLVYTLYKQDHQNIEYFLGGTYDLGNIDINQMRLINIMELNELLDEVD